MVQKMKDINWVAIGYLLGLPAATIYLFPKALAAGVFFWPIIIYAIIHYAIEVLSITVGYHRLISHKAFEAHPAVKTTVLLIGAGTFQNSALIWARDHRIHHREVDSENDPYSISKGFWYAHFFWMFFKDPPEKMAQVPADLKKDKLVQLQHKYYLPIALLVGFGLPMLVGYFMGSVFAGLYVGAMMRLLVSGHCTFAINSVAHVVGTRPYSVHNSARDNWFLSFFTAGEGYHNYHHKFQADYRNGHVWYAWDPSKWTIYLLSKLGLADKLIRVDHHKIEIAKMEVTELKLERKGWNVSELVKQRMEHSQVLERLGAMRAEIQRIKAAGRAHMDRSEASMLLAYRTKINELKAAKRKTFKAWKEQKKLIKTLPRLNY